MEDFNSFVKNQHENPTPDKLNMDKNLFGLISSLSNKFDGKSQSDLIKAIYEEAKKGKQNGTLSNADIDNFREMLSPLLDDKKRKILLKVTEELKKI
jgi:hypothetical protein